MAIQILSRCEFQSQHPEFGHATKCQGEDGQLHQDSFTVFLVVAEFCRGGVHEGWEFDVLREWGFYESVSSKMSLCVAWCIRFGFHVVHVGIQCFCLVASLTGYVYGRVVVIVLVIFAMSPPKVHVFTF